MSPCVVRLTMKHKSRRKCDLDHVPFARMKRVRLDTLLSERGMFPSRSRAAASVLAGEVLLLPDRRRAEKPGQLVREDVELELRDTPQVRLPRRASSWPTRWMPWDSTSPGARALDVGASTGGFTDCLLQRGAEHVVAVDVAYGELDWRLRNDARVTVIERRNARSLRPDELPYAPDLIVIDVSFISLEKVLPRCAGVRGCAVRLPGDGQAAVRGRARARRQGWRGARRRPRGAARWWRSAMPAAGWARRCSATPARGCRARRATSRRSCGWPRRSRSGVADLELAASEVEP